MATVVHRHFYPRSPCGERPRLFATRKSRHKISIHALLAESDLANTCAKTDINGFLSTLSLRRATACIRPKAKAVGISIHALLAESDSVTGNGTTSTSHFYPRSPCGERLSVPDTPTRVVLFLSTLSLRRATYQSILPPVPYSDFYPRSPCGERHHMPAVHVQLSIFLSTLSLRRATPFGRAVLFNFLDFYPRSPCGERQYIIAVLSTGYVFLSTLSLRRATLVRGLE